MSIYTKTGDDGLTSVFGGKRVSKSSLQIEALGSLDELNSYLGLVMTKVKDEKGKRLLLMIQRDLYQIMAVLSGAAKDLKELEGHIKKFEQFMDESGLKLPKLKGFILPTGEETACWFHVLRAITRRAERRVVELFSKSQLPITNYQLPILKYLNRLSDLFFVMARRYNEGEEITV